MITNEELETMGRASLAQIESRLQQLQALAKAGEGGHSWQPPNWAGHLDNVKKLRWMAGVYWDLQEILRKRLGAMVALAVLAGGGCCRTSVQVSATYTDGPCTVTVQQYWR